MSPVVWPTGQYVLLVCHIVINVIMVSKYRVIPLSTLVMFPVLLVVFTMFEKTCIKSSAQVYECSREFIVGLGKGYLYRRQKMVARSLRPLSVTVGTVYIIKLSTFTTYLRIVVDSSINILLAMKQQTAWNTLYCWIIQQFLEINWQNFKTPRYYCLVLWIIIFFNPNVLEIDRSLAD